MKKILITGGLSDILSQNLYQTTRVNYQIIVLDLMIYGENVLDDHQD